MVDKFYFTVCLVGLMVSCIVAGWSLHQTAVEQQRNSRRRRSAR